jgi:DNA-binding response OmpR family regulator
MAADLEMTPDPGTDDARPIRLRLVEDDDGDAFLVTELLDEAGVATDVTRARTVAEARELLTDGEAPDCVLLDLGLPDASGLDALTQVREVAQTAALVVLTGDVDRSRGSRVAGRCSR